MFMKKPNLFSLGAFAAGLAMFPLAPAYAQAPVPAAPATVTAAARPLPKPSAPDSYVGKHGQLRVQGTKIVDQAGQPIALHGMSLFWSQWIGKFYTPETIKWLKDDWRCTVVRAAMAVGSNGYLNNPEQEKAKVFTVVDAAIEQGIYVIVDWHDHNGEQHSAQSQAFFAELAQRYAKYPNIIYEPYNEPLQGANWSTVLKPYHEGVIKAIRQHDPDNIIVCGTRVWSQRVDEAADDPIQAENIAYTLHYYASTHKQGLRDIAQKAIDKGICLFVTEFGTSEASGNGEFNTVEARTWFDFLDKNDISWANWSVADARETSAALKPGAAATGGWADDVISPSGLFIREELRRKNPAPTAALTAVKQVAPLKKP
jgi:endoglucanase